MHNKHIRFFLLVAGLAGIGLISLLITTSMEETPPPPASDGPADLDRRVERVDDGRVLRVVDNTGTTVRRYSIDAFNEWTTTHWDEIFNERPAFGEIRDVDFDDFRQFDGGVALSPETHTLAFSVSDYAAATTLSVIGFLDVASGTVSLVDSVNRGRVDDIHWSPGGHYVAYRLHTARAHGDGLSADRAVPPEKLVSLTGRNVLAALDGAGGTRPASFRPAFDDLAWVNERCLSLTSRVPNDGRTRWQLGASGWKLQRVE